MSPIEFIPSKQRTWRRHDGDRGTFYITGWAYADRRYLKGIDFARHLDQALTSSCSLEQTLSTLNGNFAIVWENADVFHIAADTVRSIPLFYRVRDQHITVSDSASMLFGADSMLDEDSLLEFRQAGFVTGPHTLYQDVFGLQSGECVSWEKSTACRNARRYYEYVCTYDEPVEVDQWCEAFDQCLNAVFSSLIRDINRRQIVIPLSGGLDSRLVASWFRRLGYDNVLCFSYGLKQNKDSQVSQQIASELNFPWVQIEYTGSLWKDALRDPELFNYWDFAANGVSLPHCDDWLAVRQLKREGLVEEDAVFVPGHTGDFICGSHLKYVFDPRWQRDIDFQQTMIQKHFSLWEFPLDHLSEFNAIIKRMDEALEDFGGTQDEDLAQMYEFWEWQERQTKFIINAVRVYDFFGFDWRIPLWDLEVMRLWQHVPISLKVNKYLYRYYLSNYDPTGVFKHEAPTAPWDRNDVVNQLDHNPKEKLKHWLRNTPALSKLLWRYEKLRVHHNEYNYHPQALAQAYGWFRYVLREPSKRHSQAVLARAVLKHFSKKREQFERVA